MTDPDALRDARQLLAAEEQRLVQMLDGERSRKRGALNQRLHEVRQALRPGYRYASQAGQDVFVDRLFNGARGRVFADVGAYDGVTGSNTLFLEQMRGWTGVLVEPVTETRDAAQLVRRSPVLPYAIGAASGQAEFMTVTSGYTQMSGLTQSYDPSLLEQVRTNPAHGERTEPVELRALADVLSEAGHLVPDYLSLDIEGGEMDALAAFPFANHPIPVWSIENNAATPELSKIMRKNSYELVEFCGQDEIFVHSAFRP